MTMTTTERLETQLGKVLRVSSLASTAMLALGLALAIAGPDLDAQMYLLRSGLIILLGGPIARVAVSAVTYARAGEWSSAGLAVTVFVVLMASAVVALQTRS
jgi:uncharacterized membrane protein